MRQKPGKGAAVVAGVADGPNIKGDPEQEIKLQFEATRRGDTDPLTESRIPKKHRQHAREYFDRFREGK